MILLQDAWIQSSRRHWNPRIFIWCLGWIFGRAMSYSPSHRRIQGAWISGFVLLREAIWKLFLLSESRRSGQYLLGRTLSCITKCKGTNYSDQQKYNSIKRLSWLCETAQKSGEKVWLHLWNKKRSATEILGFGCFIDSMLWVGRVREWKTWSR